MKLTDIISKIPGGNMLIPMAISAIINTLFPSFHAVCQPTTALFSSSGTMALIAIFLVLIGIQFKSNQLVASLKHGGVLVILKLLISIVFGVIIMKFFGLNGFWGISTLALVVTISSANPGIYIALMESYGNDIDVANFTLLNMIGLPFVPICILGFSSGNGINYMSIISIIAPFLVGILIAILDSRIRAYSKNGIKLLLPFLGFCLGANINLNEAMQSIGMGFVLFLIYTVTNNLPLIATDKYIYKQKGHVAAAICCVAGLAIAIPDLMAEINSTYLPYVNSARSQIAFTVVTSSVFTPLLVKKLASSKGR